MASTHLSFTPQVSAYYRSVAVREPTLLRRLREETAQNPQAHMQISPELGQFFRLLAETQGFRRVLEVGVFTGYSSLNLALSMPADGRIVACDISLEWTAMARRYWREAGVENKIDLRIAPAMQTLREMEPLERGKFDFAFIDADKESYDGYYELALSMLRPGGLMALDNVLRGGRIADASNHDLDVEVLRALNAKILRDDRVTPAIIPYGDGLTLLRKRNAE